MCAYVYQQVFSLLEAGCGGDLRGGDPAEHAVCPGQERRPASCSHAASHAGAVDPAADDAGKRVPGASCRIRDRRRARLQACARADGEVFGEGAPAIDLPALAHTALRPLVAQVVEGGLRIKTIEKELLAWHRTSQESRRLETIPGVRFITATAIAATVTDPSHFRSMPGVFGLAGADPAAKFIGWKGAALAASRRSGNGYLRSPLIVVGATAMIRYAPRKGRGQCLMDQRAAREEAGSARFGCCRQQNGEDRLGAARQEGRLSDSGPRCRVGSQLRVGPPEDRKVFQLGKGDYGVMQTGRDRGLRTNPRLCQSIKLVNVNGVQSADIIRVSGHRSRA